MSGKQPIEAAHALKLWRAENKLYFSRFQTIALLQVAGFAGWYKLCYDGHTRISMGLMLATAVLGCALGYLMRLDQIDAAHYRGIYFETYNDERARPPMYGMTVGLFVVYMLVLVDLIFASFGCSCVLGDVWKCGA